MIDIETNSNNTIVKISDDWCDKNTIDKIRRIMTTLSLTDDDIMDWEILAGTEIYPTEEDKKLAHDAEDKYEYRDRWLTTTVTEQDGSKTSLSWYETLDMDIREKCCHPIKLYLLFVMGEYFMNGSRLADAIDSL